MTEAASSPGAPVVSVAMLAYNHEPYLAQAIGSVLAQRVDFPVEIVVGEDCSTDETRAALLRLAAEHPGRIRPLLHDSNLGMHGNTEAVLDACRGELVAFLEGDDYWTDPEKLALQVDALRADATLVGSYHLVENLSSLDSGEPGRTSHPCYRDDRRLSFEDLLWSCGMSTCSVIFRRRAWPGYPSWVRGTEGRGLADLPAAGPRRGLPLPAQDHGRVPDRTSPAPGRVCLALPGSKRSSPAT